jgi:hypothetical protein
MQTLTVSLRLGVTGVLVMCQMLSLGKMNFCQRTMSEIIIS